MKYSDIFHAYDGIADNISLPLGVPESQKDFNQLQNELDAVSIMMASLTDSINTGVSLPSNYALRAHGLTLDKNVDGLWEINPTRVIPLFPHVFTKQQIRRINKCRCVIIANARKLITCPNLIDYVGKDSQLDWASIGFLLQYGIDLIDSLESYYNASIN